jgi:hypothetical protein
MTYQKDDPNNPWPHMPDCMCRKCCNSTGRLATVEELEGILREETDPGRRATAYAALTLTRILAPEWTHVVTVRGPGKGEVRHETVQKPAGLPWGSLKELQQRLATLCWDLR